MKNMAIYYPISKGKKFVLNLQLMLFSSFITLCTPFISQNLLDYVLQAINKNVC